MRSLWRAVPARRARPPVRPSNRQPREAISAIAASVPVSGDESPVRSGALARFAITASAACTSAGSRRCSPDAPVRQASATRRSERASRSSGCGTVATSSRAMRTRRVTASSRPAQISPRDDRSSPSRACSSEADGYVGVAAIQSGPYPELPKVESPICGSCATVRGDVAGLRVSPRSGRLYG